jgi:type IV pilus assembly protein PilQ
LVITDVEENVREIAEMAKKLDLPTGQVRIDSRIVEASRDFSQELGIKWGGKAVKTVGSRADPTGTLRLGRPPGGGNIVDLPVTIPAGALSLGWLSSKVALRNLDIELSALEETGDVKIVSKPSVLCSKINWRKYSWGRRSPLPRGMMPRRPRSAFAWKTWGRS